MHRIARRALALAVALALTALASTSAWADEVVVVRPGDNVFRIAMRHGSTVTGIVRANGLASADRIYAGQRLVVPSVGDAVPSHAGGTGGTAETHVVAPGDTLLLIAQRTGTSVASLVTANGLVSADRIYVGQRLTVPGRGMAAVGGAPVAPVPAAAPGASRQIVVDLSSQTLTAMAGGEAVNTFVVSTGAAGTPTPVGHYRITSRYATQHMVGPGYNLPGVPYVQYFTGSYAIHGTYWHTSFGVPVSHGCVNMRTADAGWLWRWSTAGTPVIVRW